MQHAQIMKHSINRYLHHMHMKEFSGAQSAKKAFQLIAERTTRRALLRKLLQNRGRAMEHTSLDRKSRCMDSVDMMAMNSKCVRNLFPGRAVPSFKSVKANRS